MLTLSIYHRSWVSPLELQERLGTRPWISSLVAVVMISLKMSVIQLLRQAATVAVGNARPAFSVT
jgi:hypothetical protein